MRDFLLDDADRAFRAEVRGFLAGELAPRVAATEEHEDWNTVRDVVRAIGEAGYLRLMFRDLYQAAMERVIAEFCPNIYNGYGMTEDSLSLLLHPDDALSHLGSCGKPTPARPARGRRRERGLSPGARRLTPAAGARRGRSPGRRPGSRRGSARRGRTAARP